MFIYGKHLYQKSVQKLIAFNYKEFLEALDTIQNHINSKKFGYFVGYISYEAGVMLQINEIAVLKSLYKNIESLQTNMPTPLLYFELFKKRSKIPKEFFHTNIDSKKIFNIQKNLDKDRFQKDFQNIKNHIKNGDTYQVNYTQQLELTTEIKNSLDIFKYFAKKQDTQYKAYIKNDMLEIASFSPELFFKLKGNKIITQPMKGTIKRGFVKAGEKLIIDKKLDKENIKTLAKDSKNISENVMIVDLLRNDLSKIAKHKSVKVKDIFSIHTYPTLHQMVSTIEAKLPKSCGLLDIFKAIFPSGSISGAPKIKTMQIINSLENRKRDVYCGAIGVISTKTMNFSVPIRILTKSRNENFYKYNVGSGIVWDSDIESEWEELRLKCQFLGINQEDSNTIESLDSYMLFETMLCKKDNIFLLNSHLLRMLNSAKKLGFNTAKLQNLIDINNIREKDKILDFKNIKLESFNPDDFPNLWHKFNAGSITQQTSIKNNTKIVKLMLNKNGDLLLYNLKLNPIDNKNIMLYPYSLYSNNIALFHKTTKRGHYHYATNKVSKNKVFDIIYTNEKDELTEGSRSNIILKIGDKYYTPKLDSGLLNGTLRDLLIESHLCIEKKLYTQDLKKANKIFCINSVRGIVAVKYNKGIK